MAGGLAWAGAPAAWHAAGGAFGFPRTLPFQGYFRVAEVDVEGNLHLGREDVARALDLADGTSLLTLDLAGLAARLAANPWVKEATLQRRLPDRLLVRLVERAPAAVLVAGAAYLVSGDGVLLEEGADDDARAALPVLRAPAGRRYAVGERVAPQELNEALGAWRQVQIAPVLEGRRPREVALAPDGSYRIQMAPGAFVVRLGADGLEQQLKRLGAVMALRGGALDDVEEVDLRFPQKVILRQRPAGARSVAERRGRPPVEGTASSATGGVPFQTPIRVPPPGEPPARHHPGGEPPERRSPPGVIDGAPDLRLVPRGGAASG